MSTIVVDPIGRGGSAPPASAVSWGAILAGGAAAAALSLVMLILGSGLGLAAVSPWAYGFASAATLGMSAIIWISLTQILASGMGGYLAGRLRTKWADIQNDEVYFRDTAHGFLAWCVASLGTAAVLTSVVGSIVSGGVQAGAAAAGAASTAVVAAVEGVAGDDAGLLGYRVDSLFRADGSGGERQEPEESAAALAEVTRIFANGIRTGSLPEEDARYVARVVAQRADLTINEAEQRVRETFTGLQTTLREAEEAVRVAAEEARQASAYAALWFVVSLLIGAFVASFMATYGGRQRDL